MIDIDLVTSLRPPKSSTVRMPVSVCTSTRMVLHYLGSAILTHKVDHANKHFRVRGSMVWIIWITLRIGLRENPNSYQTICSRQTCNA